MDTQIEKMAVASMLALVASIVMVVVVMLVVVVPVVVVLVAVLMLSLAWCPAEYTDGGAGDIYQAWVPL
jgi:hypothetical protein